MMAKVYDLKTGQRQNVSSMEFLGLLDTVVRYIDDIRPLREEQNGLNTAIKIVDEMKFSGLFNQKLRDEWAPQLEELLDDMYIEINKIA